MRVWVRFIFVTAVVSVLLFGSDSNSSAETVAGRGMSAATMKEDQASTSKSCVVNLAEFPDPLVDAPDLERLMQHYFNACHYDLSAIDKVYETEARDERWAGSVEKKIQEVAAGFAGLQITGECHESLCRIDFQRAQPAWTLEHMLDFDHKLLPLVKGTESAVGVSAVPFQGGIRQYFYTEVLPAAFLQPLRGRIGK